MLNHVERYLTSRGAWWVKIHGDEYQRRGTPDILACVDGRFVALEGKRAGEHPTPLQAYTLEQIRKSGGIAEVARNVADVERILERMEQSLVCN